MFSRSHFAGFSLLRTTLGFCHKCRPQNDQTPVRLAEDANSSPEKESQAVAKASEGVSKSAAIREILAEDMNTPTKEVIATLKQQGIKIHPNLVYLMKSQMKARRRKQNRKKALANGQQLGIANPVDLILEVRRLSDKAGGIRHLKKLVDVLAE